MISNTIEESIHELSVKRRLEHLGHAAESKKGKGRALTDEELVARGLEEANSLELQETILADLLAKGKGGELVSENDLWACLFGGRTKRNTVDLNGGGAIENPDDTADLNRGSAMGNSEDSEDSVDTVDLNGSGVMEDPLVIG